MIQLDGATKSVVEAQHDVHEQQQTKMRTFASLVNLRNANAAGIAFENRKRIVAAFSRPGKPEDSGSPEVQGRSHGVRLRLSPC